MSVLRSLDIEFCPGGTSGSGLPGAVAGPANQDKIGKQLVLMWLMSDMFALQSLRRMLKELMKFEKRPASNISRGSTSLTDLGSGLL